MGTSANLERDATNLRSRCHLEDMCIKNKHRISRPWKTFIRLDVVTVFVTTAGDRWILRATAIPSKAHESKHLHFWRFLRMSPICIMSPLL